MDKKSFVNLENASHRPDGVYKNVMREIQRAGVCPFCPKNLARYHKRPIIKTGKYWILTDNMYPYKGARHHLLLIHKKHIERFSQITREAWKELRQITDFAAQKRSMEGGALVMRFGKTAYTGASVSHLHANVIGADDKNKKREPIMFRIG